ncbi:MAG: 50S ribosomal protein L24 [Candidatus Bathycorpusculaceae bacterium]
MQTLKPVTKPSKQRKMLYQAPDHIRHKFFAAPLSPELKASYGLNSIPVRSGDTVRIMRGDHKGFEGKITRVDRKKFRIYVEGLTREKVDGTTIFVPLHPSKVMITRLNLDDKWRKEVLEKKKKARKKPEEVVEVKEKIIEEKVTVEKKKPPEKKPRKKKRKRETAKKSMKKEEKAEKIEEKVSKTRRQRAKRKTTKKKEGEK